MNFSYNKGKTWKHFIDYLIKKVERQVTLACSEVNTISGYIPNIKTHVINDTNIQNSK